MIAPDLVQAFGTECAELLPQIETGLLALETDPNLQESLHAVFRAAHTLKSSGAIVEQPALSRFANDMETLLQALRAGEREISPPLIGDLLSAKDVLAEMINRVLAGGNAAEVDAREVQEALKHWIQGGPAGTARTPMPGRPVPTCIYRIQLAPSPHTLRAGIEPSSLLGELRRVSKILSLDANLDGLPRIDELDPGRLYLSWSVVVETDLSAAGLEALFFLASDGEEGSVRVEPVDPSAVSRIHSWRESGPSELAVGAPVGPYPSAAQASPGVPPVRRADLTVRVESEKLDALLDLVGELILCSSQVLRTAPPEARFDEERRAAAEHLERLVRDLQTRVMSARMTAVGELFSRFRRLVRDLGRDLGKSVGLEIRGADTELDKNLVELLDGPLKHMIRNSVDHGMEPPEERERAGKPRTGTILLDAQHQEDYILITVADDGRGISRARVLARAAQLGLVTDGGSLTDQEVYEFLFRPGFSTAVAVSEVSGRGVGLDVVRSNVNQLRGRIDVESREGTGTRFQIRLPLTLAIVDGMTAHVGAQTVTFPVSSVTELVQPREADIRRVDGDQELLFLRKEYIPVIHLQDVYAFPARARRSSEGTVVVVQTADRRFGVLVDRISGLGQAVVKPLQQYFALTGKVAGVSGATVLGDGSISMMVDVYGLQLWLEQSHRKTRLGLAGSTRDPHTAGVPT